METIWSKKSDNILKVGFPLNDIGVLNWALTREQALSALDQFEVEGIPILGGDVYEMQGKVFQPNYNNWFCDREKNESKLDFVTRSITKARDYINSYKFNRDTKNFFSIVPEE